MGKRERGRGRENEGVRQLSGKLSGGEEGDMVSFRKPYKVLDCRDSRDEDSNLSVRYV